MRVRLMIGLSLLVGALARTSDAAAEDPQGFIQREHQSLDKLLHQPASTGRDSQVNQILDTMVDYDVLAHRAFGDPCPPSEPSCKNLWTTYTDSQRDEVRGLLRQLVEKSYRKNLLKTLDYDVTYRGSREASGDTRVLTEAKNKVKPREPAVRIDYIVQQTPRGYRVVDILTEGSSLAKNYYDQFAQMQYTEIVKKLRDKLAKP